MPEINEVALRMTAEMRPAMRMLMLKAKDLYPNIPFIILTAQGSIESAVDAIRQGALDYLEKPFMPASFGVSAEWLYPQTIALPTKLMSLSAHRAAFTFA